MDPYQNILVVIDGKENRSQTVSKAMCLSKRSNANVTFLNISNEQEASSPNFEHSSIYNEVSGKDLSTGEGLQPQITLKSQTGNSEYRMILNELSDVHYDLVIKGKAAQHFNYLGLAMSTDWHLLRESNVPLLLVTNHLWQQNGAILTAVETEESSKAHQFCNHQIIENSKQLAEMLQSNIHLLNCYLGEPVSMSISERTRISEKRHHWQDLVKASKELNGKGAETKLFLEVGLPDEVIPNLALKNNVNMVVMGTSEHNGIFNNIFGHTSEYIIDKLNCDVLAIKPAFEQLH